MIELRRSYPISLSVATVLFSMSRLFFLLLIFSITLLPSGTLGSFNFKVILFQICLISVTAYTLTRGRHLKKIVLNLSYYFVISVVLSFWWLLGAVNSEEFASAQIVGILSTLFVCLLCYASLELKIVKRATIGRAIISGAVLYCAIKIIVVCLIALKIVSFVQFLRLMEFFNYIPVTQIIFGNVIRIQLINDILSPFALAGILIYSRGSKKLDVLSIVGASILFISILLSYSRFTWLILFLVVLMYFFYHQFNMRKTSLVFILVLAGLTSYGLFGESIGASLGNRFSNQLNEVSDTTRSDQIIGLLGMFDQSPVIGNGLGSYVKTVIRDVSQPYTYEVQWLSLLMQMGILGIFVLILAILPLYFRLFHYFTQKHFLMTSLLLTVWVLSGFTNPYLTSSTAGLVFSFFIVWSSPKAFDASGKMLPGSKKRRSGGENMNLLARSVFKFCFKTSNM